MCPAPDLYFKPCYSVCNVLYNISTSPLVRQVVFALLNSSFRTAVWTINMAHGRLKQQFYFRLPTDRDIAYCLPVALVLGLSDLVLVPLHLHEQEGCMVHWPVHCLCKHAPVRWTVREGCRDQRNLMASSYNKLWRRKAEIVTAKTSLNNNVHIWNLGSLLDIYLYYIAKLWKVVSLSVCMALNLSDHLLDHLR